MKRFWERLKNEPQLIGSLILVILNLAAAFGLGMTEEQRNAILTGVPVIVGIGFGIRSRVTPTRTIPQGPVPAELDPRLLRGERRHRG